MKVRWNGSSLRLRITPSEMDTVVSNGQVLECLEFPGGLAWRVILAAGPETALVSDGTSVLLSLSPADRTALAAPEAEGVYFGTPDGLRFYVEKDFPCVHPRAAESREPATPTFEAPSGFEQRKNTAS